jgi:hypothetical protein
MRAHEFSLSLALIGSVGLVSLLPAAARAQVELPSAAPAAKLTQQVGLTDISLEYDCPAAGGRKVWNGVVPFGQIWLAGSKSAARFKVSRDVKIGDDTIPAGSYWLLAIPGADVWTIIINKSVEPIRSTHDYRPELDIGLLKVTPKLGSKRDRLIFTFSGVTDDRASLDLDWDGVRVSIPIEVDTAQQVQNAINSLDGLWRSYANAARYMLETKKDYDAGLRYIDQALALKEDWYSMWVKGALFAAKGDYGVARDWAVRAHDLAMQSGNAGGLEADLNSSIAEWGRRSGRMTKEASALPKVDAPPGERSFEKVDRAERVSAKSDEPVARSASPKSSAPPPPSAFKAATETDTNTPPLADPPVMRRARLRHR